MANFVVIIDTDPERRSQFIKTIEPMLPPTDGLIVNSCTTGDFHAIWAIHPRAPVNWVANRDGAAVVWGEAIPQNEQVPVDATSLRNLWKNSRGESVLPAFDGFHASLAYHPDFGLTVAADAIGLFPVYYYTRGDVAIVASSPELLRYHNCVKTAFNPAGLVGILLTNGLFEGQTLWQNIRRLNAGHALIWKPATSPIEVPQYQIPGDSQHNPYSHLTFSEHLDILEKIIDRTLSRMAPSDRQYSLLLSGGLDSRMLAGFLHRKGINPVTLTLGKHADIEMECAIPVARTLGLKHRAAELQMERYPDCANSLVKWEHLANGFNSIAMGWGLHSILNDLAARVVAGYSIDTAFAGAMPVTRSNETMSFEIFFNRGINSWGFSPDLLERLLRKEVFGDLVADTLARIQTLYESYSDVETRRTFWFELYHRQRFHVGSLGWQICFGAWPVLPILSLELLQTTAVLPDETMGKRRSQKELMCTRLPQLARLPLDRNDYNLEPLLPSKRRQQLARLFSLQRKWRRWQQKLGFERRYYYRILDINNAGWQAVRREAEPYRQRVQHLFCEDVFDEIVPTPDVFIQSRADPIMGVSGIKALLGFLLWSRDYL